MKLVKELIKKELKYGIHNYRSLPKNIRSISSTIPKRISMSEYDRLTDRILKINKDVVSNNMQKYITIQNESIDDLKVNYSDNKIEIIIDIYRENKSGELLIDKNIKLYLIMTFC